MDLTRLFCEVDDFIKNNADLYQESIDSEPDKRSYKARDTKLSDSEVMTLCIAFHQSCFRNIKSFYLKYVTNKMKQQFPQLVSYNRFVELQKKVLRLLAAFLKRRLGEVTGISYIDSTPLRVCKTKRISKNKVFKDIGKIGKSSMGWFFGFKLHLIVSEVGELLSVSLTPGNIDDRHPVMDMTNNIFGKLFGDKGYVSQKLMDDLRKKSIHLITHVKKNMKNKLLDIMDKILLRKRSIIETINDQIKNISQIEHSRHRSPWNFLNNVLSALIAYTFQEKKPRINFQDLNFEAALLD